MSFQFLDQYTRGVNLQGTADPDVVTLAQGSKPLDVKGFGEMASLGYDAAAATWQSFVSSRTYDGYEDAIDKARAKTGKTLANPHVVPSQSPDERRKRLARTLRGEDVGGVAEEFPQRQERFFLEYDELRKQHPDLPDPRSFRQQAIDEIKRRRAEFKAADVGSTGLGDIGAFVGELGAEFQRTENVITLPLGAPAALYSPVRTGLMAGLGRVLGVGAVESTIAAGSQLLSEVEKVPRLQSYGVKYDWDEAWGNVLGAAGAGFILGGGMRTMVAGWRAVRGGREGQIGRDFAEAFERQIDEGEFAIPADRRAADIFKSTRTADIAAADDAVVVAERILARQASNPLGEANIDAHSRAMEKATDDLFAGRPVDVAPVMRELDDVRAEGQRLLTEARKTAEAMAAPVEGLAARAVEAPKAATQMFTPTGRRIDVGYEVVDVRTLIPSHTDEFKPNIASPRQLQPRDRARAANQQQVAEIAGGMQPERMGKSADATTGAPIVAPDNVVESGNGRVLALRRVMAENGAKAKEYRAWLEQQGYDTSGIELPVLVARRQTPLDEAERMAFVREANAPTAARMAAAEQAASDAKLVTRVIDLYRGGDVAFAQNSDFVRAFLKGIPPSERGALWTETGGLSQDGVRRLQGALLHAAYDDTALVGKLMESTNNDIKAIGGALLDVAPAWAQMRDAARRGAISAEVDKTADLLNAVRMVENARQTGTRVADLLAQGSLFDQPEMSRLFLGALFNDAGLERASSRAAVGQKLRTYVDEANKTDSAPHLFGEVASAPSEIMVATDKQRVLAGLVDDARLNRKARDGQEPGPQKSPPPVEPEVIVKNIEQPPVAGVARGMDDLLAPVKTPDDALAFDAEAAKASVKALNEVKEPEAEAILAKINKGRAERGELPTGARPDREGQEPAGVKPAEHAGTGTGRAADTSADARAGEVPGAGGEGAALSPADAKIEAARRTVDEGDVAVPAREGDAATKGRALLDEADREVNAAEIIRNCAIGSAI